MTPREEAQVEAEKTFAAFIKMSKRISIFVCILVFVVVVIFDSGVG
jgi:hypothetical protein